MKDRSLPARFVIGQKYRDREGEYTVIGIKQDQITIERPDGRCTIEPAELKARIHRNVVAERDANVKMRPAYRTGKRGGPTKRRKELIDRILQLEADGLNHSGVEIDRALVGLAPDLGYSKEDVFKLHPKTGRSVFGNDGDWAKATMTEERLHEVIDTASYWDGDARRQCNVYRITSAGLAELRRPG
jgi:hypothetical protein